LFVVNFKETIEILTTCKWIERWLVEIFCNE